MTNIFTLKQLHHYNQHFMEINQFLLNISTLFSNFFCKSRWKQYNNPVRVLNQVFYWKIFSFQLEYMSTCIRHTTNVKIAMKPIKKINLGKLSSILISHFITRSELSLTYGRSVVLESADICNQWKYKLPNIRKLSKIGRDQKTLFSAFVWVLKAIAKN